MPTYRQILSRAWALTRTKPALWLFGLFVVWLGNGGEIELLRRNVTLGGGQGLIRDLIAGFFSIPADSNIFIGITETLTDQSGSLIFGIILLLLAVGFGLAIVWLIIVSQGALIANTVSLLQKKELKISDVFQVGVTKFWPVLGFNIISRIVFWLLAASLTALLALALLPEFFLVYLIGFIAIMSLIITVSFITKFAIFESVLNNKNFRPAFREALKLFRKNWLVVIEVALLLFIIFWLVNTLVVGGGLLIFLSAVRWFHATPLALVLLEIFLALIFIVVQIGLAVFHWVSWILVFEILQSKKMLLSRVLNGLGRLLRQ